jgi:hypothetical protein
MSHAELAAKSMDCAILAASPLPPDTAARLIAAVEGLEWLPDITALMRIVTPGQGAPTH